MSDYLFVVLPRAQLPADAGDDLAEYVKRACAGAVPHNRLSHFRANLTRHGEGTLLEPLVPGGLNDVVLHAVVDWAKGYSPSIRIRLEGHRGRQPLPDRAPRSGTLHDVLSFRSDRRKPHNIEFVLVPADP